MPTLDKVSVDLMVVLGTTTMPIHQVMRLSRGAIIELDATEADEVKILANGRRAVSHAPRAPRARVSPAAAQIFGKPSHSPSTRLRKTPAAKPGA